MSSPADTRAPEPIPEYRHTNAGEHSKASLYALVVICTALLLHVSGDVEITALVYQVSIPVIYGIASGIFILAMRSHFLSMGARGLLGPVTVAGTTFVALVLTNIWGSICLGFSFLYFASHYVRSLGQTQHRSADEDWPWDPYSSLEAVVNT